MANCRIRTREIYDLPAQPEPADVLRPLMKQYPYDEPDWPVCPQCNAERVHPVYHFYGKCEDCFASNCARYHGRSQHVPLDRHPEVVREMQVCEVRAEFYRWVMQPITNPPPIDLPEEEEVK